MALWGLFVRERERETAYLIFLYILLKYTVTQNLSKAKQGSLIKHILRFILSFISPSPLFLFSLSLSVYLSLYIPLVPLSSSFLSPLSLPLSLFLSLFLSISLYFCLFLLLYLSLSSLSLSFSLSLSLSFPSLFLSLCVHMYFFFWPVNKAINYIHV